MLAGYQAVHRSYALENEYFNPEDVKIIPRQILAGY